jgi:hypothetical protein
MVLVSGSTIFVGSYIRTNFPLKSGRIPLLRTAANLGKATVSNMAPFNKNQFVGGVVVGHIIIDPIGIRMSRNSMLGKEFGEL